MPKSVIALRRAALWYGILLGLFTMALTALLVYLARDQWYAYAPLALGLPPSAHIVTRAVAS